jgi:two-component system cell cycle sensor histidine kinase PleC
MTISALKQRVEARDRLLQQAEQVGQQLNAQVLLALARGELTAAEAAARSHDAQLHELTENLRIYQAELHAQADELAASQARTDALLSRFSTLFSNMPVAALLVAANGEVLEHNAVAGQLMGLRAQYTVARFLHRLVDNDSFQRLVRPAFLEAQNSGHSVAENVHFVGEAGRPFVGELHIAKLRQGQAADGAFACAVVDRTEHIENLRALQAALDAQRRSEAFLSDTGHLARTGGWELTLHPRELRWSAHLRDVMGLGIHEPATLETLLSHCAPYDRWALSSAMAAAEQGAPFEIEVDMQGPAGACCVCWPQAAPKSPTARCCGCTVCCKTSPPSTWCASRSAT